MHTPHHKSINPTQSNYSGSIPLSEKPTRKRPPTHISGYSQSSDKETFGGKDKEQTQPISTLHAFNFGNISTFPNQPPAIQPKLTINRPGDKYEQEADRLADQLMPDSGMGLQRQSIKEGSSNQIQAQVASSEISSKISKEQGGGRPLPTKTQAEMSSKMGADFSKVNIHTDYTAAQLSKEIGANAFTVGNDIYFNNGQYNQDSRHGKHLLAHELTHVIQQSTMPEVGLIQCNRGMPEPTFVAPRSVYIIRESVHRIPGLPSIPNTGGQLGPFLIKIQRTVLQLHAVWQPEGGTPSTWRAIKDWLGVERIRREYTGEHRWVLTYSGFRNIVQARGGVELFDVPNLGLYTLGSDPIPHIQLYGNENVPFSTAGGREDPSAAAIYDGSNNQLEVIRIDEIPNVQERAITLPGASREPGPTITTQ